jgi:hypothetical protein
MVVAADLLARVHLLGLEQHPAFGVMVPFMRGTTLSHRRRSARCQVC